MTVKDAREKARGLKIKNYARMSKEQLIWSIQKAEGNADCFKRIESCGVLDCCWREECQTAA